MLQGQDTVAATAETAEATQAKACLPNQELCALQRKPAALPQVKPLYLLPSRSWQPAALHRAVTEEHLVLFTDVQSSSIAVDPLAPLTISPP